MNESKVSNEHLLGYRQPNTIGLTKPSILLNLFNLINRTRQREVQGKEEEELKRQDQAQSQWSNHITKSGSVISKSDLNRLWPQYHLYDLPNINKYSPYSQTNETHTRDYIRKEAIIISSNRIGLDNIGNTCYMNSCLQNLLHCSVFIEKLLSNKDNINYRTPITKRLLNLCLSIQSSISSSSSRSLSPLELKETFSQRHTPFLGHRQHDSQEFCRILLEDISYELNTIQEKNKYIQMNINKKMPKYKCSEQFDELFRKRENSIIIDTFYGQLINIYTCACDHETYSFEKILDIPLILPTIDQSSSSSSTSINELLFNYFESEEIQWESKCTQCREKTIQSKQILFTHLPEVLILSLQRNNRRRRNKKKNNIPIASEEEIDMIDFVDEDCLSLQDQDKGTQYELFGITHHNGTMEFGHYFSHVKIKGEWFEFNDSLVSKVTQSNKYNSSSVYVLFYKRK